MPSKPPMHRPHGDTAQRQRQQRDIERGTAAQRGYDGRWQKARKTFLSRHPVCAECQRQGFVTAATVVDHIVPHRMIDATTPEAMARAQGLFWDTANWQALCKPHHDQKTAKETGWKGL